MTIASTFNQVRQPPQVVCSCCRSEYSQMASAEESGASELTGGEHGVTPCTVLNTEIGYAANSSRKCTTWGGVGEDVYETKQGNLVTPEAHGLPSHMNKERISTY